MKTFIATAIGAAILSMGLTPILAWFARTRGFVDSPGTRKVHKGDIPRIGGIAIIIATLALAISVTCYDNKVGDAFRKVLPQVLTMLAASVFIGVIGFIDDLRGLRARTKFAAQVVAALAVCAVGITIRGFGVRGLLPHVELGLLEWPVTVLWIVGITNAVNLVDGLDGLAAGIAAITCAVIAAFAWHTGQPVMTVLSMAMLGSLIGFLVFNFNPARVFMGDCGSLFLGFIIATSSVMCSVKSSTTVALALPALALGIPIFDTLFSMLRRFLQRRSIFSADRGHLHHRLIDMGLNQRHAVLIMYLATFLAAGLGIFMMFMRDAGVLPLFMFAVVPILAVFRLVGVFRLKSIMADLKLKFNQSAEERRHRRDFEYAQLRLREASTFNDWWDAICRAAEDMDFARVSLDVADRDGTSHTIEWIRPGAQLAPHEIVRSTVPIRDRRSAEPLIAEIDIQVNGSVEAAGRRVAYFCRLIHQHNIATLETHARPIVA